MKIENLPLDQLSPYAGNARTHPEWQVVQIANSITEFGFTNPILIGADGVIIAGHGRLMAAKRLQLETVPVVRLDHLTPLQQRALVLADNRIAENAGWDEDMLARELAALREEAFDLDLTGFSEEDVDKMLAGLDDETSSGPAALGDPDFVPDPPPAPIAVRGQIWQLGPHRLMCGDSTSKADVAALCGADPVDCCWTDPPYNVNYEGSAGKIQNDNMEASAFRRFLCDAFSAAASVMSPGAPIYVAHADAEGYAFRGAFKDAGFKLSGCLVWVKPSLVLGRSDYQWRHEPILYGWKPGAAHRWYGARNKTTVSDHRGEPVRAMADGSLQIDMGNGQVVVIEGEGLSMRTVDESVLRFDKPARNAEHPTMKPTALILEALENSSQKGDVVLDIFGGSGSTLIAAHGSGRRARLMELDEKFVDVIICRWETYSGQKAVLEGDGRTFEQIRAARRAA